RGICSEHGRRAQPPGTTDGAIPVVRPSATDGGAAGRPAGAVRLAWPGVDAGGGGTVGGEEALGRRKREALPQVIRSSASRFSLFGFPLVHDRQAHRGLESLPVSRVGAGDAAVEANGPELE